MEVALSRWQGSCGQADVPQLGAGLLGCCNMIDLLSCCSHGESSTEEREEVWNSSCLCA